MVFANFLSSSYLPTRSAYHNSANEVSDSKRHPIELSVDIESPPCVLYGSATDSSGAVLCGLLTLSVKDPYKNVQLPEIGSNSNVSSANEQIMCGYTKVSITSVNLMFVQKVTYHKPFLPECESIKGCTNCTTKITHLKNWDIQQKPVDTPVGSYAYPFSFLIPGSFPSTCCLGSTSRTEIRYELNAVVAYRIPYRSSASYGQEQFLHLTIPIPVTRSILRGPDRNSLRVFPPTELTATAVLPNVVYPKSTFPLEMKLDGISSGDKRWRMRKLSWRIEETTRVRNNACKVHKYELKQYENDVKAKDEEKAKKPVPAITRYGDIGPQIRVALGTVDNTPLPQPGSNLPPMSHREERRETPRNEDRDEELEESDFVHPSDDALRQEIMEQQSRLREQQLEEELRNDTTVFTEEVRVVSKGDMKSGWKTNFDNNGQVDLVTTIDCMSLNSGVSNPVRHISSIDPPCLEPKNDVNIVCDIQDPKLGIYVSHILAVEIVVAEEALQYVNGQPIRNIKSPTASSSSSSLNNTDQRLAELSPMFAHRGAPRGEPVESHSLTPEQSNDSDGSKTMKIVSVPTGAARVLRMQFRLPLTERSGLGIAWNDEVPPIYQDVKELSPPDYDMVVAEIDSENSRSENSSLHSTRSNSVGGLSMDSPIPLPSTIMPPPAARHHSTSLRDSSVSQSPILAPLVGMPVRVKPWSNNDSMLTPTSTKGSKVQ